MIRSVLLATAVAAAVLVAGCAGSGATSAANATTEVPPSAPPASVAADTGGIRGVVVDDEQMPLSGARIGVIDGEGETTTAADGSFSFSNLAPGSYKVAAEKLGFESNAKGVTVLAGEVTEVRFVLKAVAIDAARTKSWTRQGFMQAGVGTPVAAQQVNASEQVFYDWYQKVDSGVMGAITGLEWTKNSAASATWMYFSLYKSKGQCDSECVRVNYTEGRSPLVVRADDLELDGKGWEVNPYLLLDGPCAATNPPCRSTDPDVLFQVVVEQKFQIHLTVSFVENLPPDASPFPPK